MTAIDMKISMLVVEDNPGDVRLLRLLLEENRSGSTLSHVDTMAAAEAYLAENAVDVVLLDLGLPDAQGIEAVRRASAAGTGTTLVVLSSLVDERMAIEALHEGAQDYFIKGEISSRGLQRSLRYAIERKRLETAALALSAKVDIARKEAKAATLAKVSIVANMQHEIRTPLHAIIGFNDLALDDFSISPVVRGYLEKVQFAGGALLTVVDDILSLSSLAPEKVELA